MDFISKTEIIMERLRSFMAIYTPPRAMGEDEQIRTIVSIAESLARKCAPSGPDALNDIMDGTLQSVADMHESYAWPTQAVFVKCLAFKAEPERIAQTDDKKAMDIAVARMMRGDPVSDRYIFGAGSAETLRSVGQDVLENYRRGIGQEFNSVYRGKATEMMAAKYGEWATKYVL
jgi:hypothetical protein